LKEEWETDMKEIRAVMLTLIIASILCLAFNIAPVVIAETTDDYPYVDAVGTYFEITNSPYLNITLTSTETVHVFLESGPRMASFIIESNNSAISTLLTLSGFEPNAIYYRHQDGYPMEEFSTDSSGGYAFMQDISEHHHVYVLEYSSTLHISSDYTFSGDIYTDIVVDANNIVIDGNGYKLQGSGTGLGFYLDHRSGVTIKNVEVTGWWFGFYLYGASTNSISGNVIAANGIGLGAYWGGHSNSIFENNIVDNLYGIYLYKTDFNNLVYHNNFIDNTRYQGYDTDPALNDWHHPDLLEGNYWSDYPGVDDGSGTGKHAIAGDGIGDTDIPWPRPDLDYYPFILESGWLTPPLLIQEEIAAIESWELDAHGWEQSLTDKLADAMQLYDKGNINGAIHKLQDLIKKVKNDAIHLTQEQKDYLIQTTQKIIDRIR
jgi:parallel beta-helix repeat protein